MFYAHKTPFVKTLFRCLFGAVVVCTFLCITVLMPAREVEAKVCFLPGRCVGEDPTQAGSVISNIRKEQGKSCLGYNLMQIKCKGQACEEGWICDSCTNAQGTRYMCSEKITPSGYTKGLYKCNTHCERYTNSGFTGNMINGQCTPIAGYSTTPPAVCTKFEMPEYRYGVEVYGNNIDDLTRSDCYYNVKVMEGYSRTKPASCTTYKIENDSYNVACYANTESIGEHFTTSTRNTTAFIVETKAGTDNVNCYRATGCNTANGWLPASDVDGNKFIYSELSSDGITCRKATACKESNSWFNNDKLGKYTGIYFNTAEETRSGLTCYKVSGCYSKAYSSEPDTRFFKSQKFDEAYSNGHKCWIITGKADYAYNAGDKKTNFFDYDDSGDKYQYDSSAKKFNTVKYYIVKNNNGRNGCMQYAYETVPDAKYFINAKDEQYSNGSSIKKTCYNITGKGPYAYAENEKIGTHFAYDDGLEGYLNGTSSKVKYYDVTGCAGYAYDTEPIATCYSHNKQTQKKGGVNTNINCWNITGKGTYAYKANERKLNYFDYSACTTAYLDGTSAQETFYTMSGCMQYAYDEVPDAKYFANSSESNYLNGVSTQKTCWNITGKGTYAYTEAEKINTHFAYDNGAEGYLNGTQSKGKYFNITQCGANAYTQETDTNYFAYNSKTGKKNGVNTSITCYNTTGCTGEAKLTTQRDLVHFSYSEKKRHFNGANAETSCYLANGCGAASALASDRNTTMYVYDNGATSNGYTCHKVNSCNKGYRQASANNGYGLTCTICGKGEYNTIAGATACVKCAAGTASNVEGAVSADTCVTCLAGKYSPQGAATCSTCAAGTWSGAGSESCTTCGTGTWSAAGASGCTKCAAGTASNVEGAKSVETCKQCAAGKYSPEGAAACSTCAAGTYSLAGSSGCTVCAAGWYSAEDGAGACTKCEAGKFNTGTGNTGCTSCPAGEFNTGTGNTTCTKCEAGKFNTGTGNTTCTACPAGEFNTGTGNTTCTKCAAGKFNTGTGNTTCTACPAGEFNTGTGNTACTKCAAGKFNTGEGNTTCTNCPAGKFNTGTGNTTCTACIAGTYSAAGADACTPCEAGKFNTGTGNTTCTACAVGKFNTGTGNTSCTVCPVGTYQTLTGQTGCTQCNEGTYNNQTGQSVASACVVCPVGTYQTAKGQSSCTQCEAGTYNNKTGQTAATACAACPVGTYQTAKGQSSCTQCNAGTFNDKTGQTAATACVTCGAGKISAVGSSACTVCPTGKYANANHTACVDCPAGKKCNNGLAEDCAVGTYQPSTGQSSCLACPVGTYQTAKGQTSCTNCNAGTYNNLTGQSAASACKTCGTGTWSGAGSETCTNCPKGTASSATGATSDATCKQCAAGTYAGKGSASCTACSAGTYSAAGAESCTGCSAGYYVNETGQSVCKKCGKGTYSTGSAATCQQCAAGTYNPNEGSTSSSACVDCTAGHYCPTGASNQVTCAAGRYAPAKSSQCYDCAAGTYSASSGSGSCSSCEAGTYSAAGSSSCTGCSGNKYSAAGASSCTDCSSGQYVNTAHTGCDTYTLSASNVTGISAAGVTNKEVAVTSKKGSTVYAFTATSSNTSICSVTVKSGNTAVLITCAKNTGAARSVTITLAQNRGPTNTNFTATFTVSQNADSCASGTKNECSAGQSQATSTSVGGATCYTCTTCAAGTYAAKGATSCSDCPVGTYQASTGQSSCTQCNAGTYNDKTKQTASTACVACPVGTYQASKGQGSCTQCSAGTYNDKTGQTAATACVDCTAGHYCPAGSGSQGTCAAGKYAPAKSSQCSDCAAGTYSASQGSGSCSNCTAGTYSSAGASACTSCSGNKYSAAKASSCTDCPSGQYVNTAYTGCDTYTLSASNVTGISAAGVTNKEVAVTSKKGSNVHAFTATSSNTNICSVTVKSGNTAVLITCAKNTGAARSVTITLAQNRGPTNTNYTATFTVSQNADSCPSGTKNECSAGQSQATSTSVGGATCYTCTTCTAGTYAAKGAASCSNCPAGQYTNTTGQSSCSTCSAGYYNSGTGNTGCSDCGAGYYCTGGANHTACAAGTSSSAANATASSTCKACSAGTYSAAGAGSCTTCSAGYYNTGTNNTGCSNCGAGHYCTGGSSRTACGKGTYSTATNATSSSTCVACTAGTYNGSTGQSACSNCTAGTSSSAGAESCTACANNTYSANNGASSCASCGSNYVNSTHTGCDTYTLSASNVTGISAAGVTNHEVAVTSKKGTAVYAFTASSSNASVCSVSVKSGNTAVLITCAKNTGAARSVTITLAQNRGPSATNFTATFTVSQNADSCASGTKNQCSAGQSQATSTSVGGATCYTCTDCTAGTYAAKGATSCSNCAANTYSGAKASSCTDCGTDKWSAAGSSSCTNCTTTYATSSLWYVSTSKPSGCYIRAGGSDSVSCGGKTYYKYKLVNSGCVTAANRTNCYKYTTVAAADGVTYYYSPQIMATNATTTKPGVTDSNCHTFSSGNPSANNGTSTTCYWNDTNVTSSKPATYAHCGTCGKKTRTPTCKSDGTGWNEGTYGSCTEFTKPATYAHCGTCGKKTRTPTCKDNGTGWNEGTYGSCTEFDKPAASETENCTLTQDCKDTSGCTDTSTSCEDSTACTATSQYCNCDGTQTRTGKRTGKKYRAGERWGTQSRTGTHTRTRTVTCNNNGTGYSTGTWSGYGTCTSSASWGACGNYGSCTYGGYGDCKDFGACQYTSWGACTSTGCNTTNHDYCDNHVCRPGNCRTVSATATVAATSASSCTNGYTNTGLCGEDNTCYICDDGTENTTWDGVFCKACDVSTFPLISAPSNANYSTCYDGSYHYKLNSCKDGYYKDGNSCVPNNCSAYPISGSCPANGNCSSCQSGSTTTYKLDSCNAEYKKNSTSTGCELKVCSDYDNRYIASCTQSACAENGTGKFTKCTKYTVRTSPNTLKCYIKETPNCSCSWSGVNVWNSLPGTSGWISYENRAQCGTSSASNFYEEEDACGEDDNCYVCNNGDDAANAYRDGIGEPYTKRTNGVLCLTCNTSTYPITGNCPTGGNCEYCRDGDNAATYHQKLNSCNTGYTKSGNTCVENACTGYTLDACPANGNCSECPSGTATKYKLDSCKTDYKKVGNTCVLKGCTDYNSNYVTDCTAVKCSSSNTSNYTTCTSYTPRTGLTCYIKSTPACNCSTTSATTSVAYRTSSHPNKDDCTAGYTDNETCGQGNSCVSCADGQSWTSFDGVFCDDCGSDYKLSSCPTNGNCSTCFDGLAAGTKHVRLDSCTGEYKRNSDNTACVLKTCYDYDTSYVDSCTASKCASDGSGNYVTCTSHTARTSPNTLTCYTKSTTACSCSWSGTGSYRIAYADKSKCTNSYTDQDKCGQDNNCLICNGGIADANGNTDKGSNHYTGTWGDGVICGACSTTTYPLSSCPTNGSCSSCYDGSYHYKLNSCDSCYHISGSSCVADTCADGGFESSCTAKACSSSNTSSYTTCEDKSYCGLSCKKKTTGNCNCTTQDATTSVGYYSTNPNKDDCDAGYIDSETCGQGNSCKVCADGSKWTTWDGVFCKDCSTSTYPVSGSCPTGCTCDEFCRDGTSASTYHYKVTGAQSGYYKSGNACYENSCSGYTLDSCPTNGSCSECQKGSSTKYKLDSCTGEYKKNSDNTACVLKECSDYYYNYTASCTEFTCPTNGNGSYVTCTEHKVRYSPALTCYSSSGPQTCSCSQSGTGARRIAYSNKSMCTNSYTDQDVCGQDNDCLICNSGTAGANAKTDKGGNHYTGTWSDGVICNACSTSTYPISADDCPNHGDCTKCYDGSNHFRLDACDSGYTKSGNSCVTASCSGYTLSSCPTNGNCSECVSGSSTKYKLDSCKSGYTNCSGTCKRNTGSGNKPHDMETEACGCGGTRYRTRTVTWNICSQSYSTGVWDNWSTCTQECDSGSGSGSGSDDCHGTCTTTYYDASSGYLNWSCTFERSADCDGVTKRLAQSLSAYCGYPKSWGTYNCDVKFTISSSESCYLAKSCDNNIGAISATF